MPAMALGAAVSAMAAQNIGAGNWDRVGADHPLRRHLQLRCITGALIVLLTLADRAALGLFLGRDSPAMPIARHIQLLATWSFLLFGVSHGAVRHGPRQRRGRGAADHLVHRPCTRSGFGFAFGATAGSAPTRLGSASRSARSRPRSWPPPSICTAAGSAAAWRRCKAAPTRWNAANSAEATREPGGALNPAG